MTVLSDKPYTVLLLYPDHAADTFGQDTYLGHVYAKNPQDAIRKVQQEVFEGDDDYYPLFVAEGHLENLAQ